MEIQLLGTGSAEGWPGLFCDCAVCRRSRKIGGKNLRSRSTALIDGTLKIDLPPDTLHHVHAQGLDLSRVKHLLFTHAHDDHCAGAELQYLSWMFMPTPLTEPVSILASATTLARLNALTDLSKLPIKLECIEPWQTAEFGRWAITALAAHHDPEQVCLNYLIGSDGRTLLYATDTGWYDRETWDFLAKRRIDGVVVECTKGLDESGYTGHLSIPEVIRMREWLVGKGVMAADGKMVTTHHSHLSGLFHADFERHLNPHSVDVGYDGMVFRI